MTKNSYNQDVWYKQTDIIDEDVEKQAQCEPFIKDECKKGFQCTGCRWFLFISFLIFVGSSVFCYFFLFQGMTSGSTAEMEFMLPDYEYLQYDAEEVIITSSTNYEVDEVANSTLLQIRVTEEEEIQDLETGEDVVLKLNKTETIDSFDEVLEEDIEIEVKPFLLEDLQRVVLVDTYDVPVDVLYSTVVGNDPYFIESWMVNQQSFDMEFGEWVSGEDKLKGQTVRDIAYKVKTDNILISAGYLEVDTKQVLYRSSEKGVRYAVDSFNQMHGIPFSDTFYSVTRQNFRAISENQSELRISGALRYYGKPWKFMRDMLEKNVFSEFESQYADLGKDLKVYFAQLR